VYRSRISYRELCISFKNVQNFLSQHTVLSFRLSYHSTIRQIFEQTSLPALLRYAALWVYVHYYFSAKHPAWRWTPLNFVHIGYRGCVPGLKKPECKATLSRQCLSLRTNGAIPLFLTTPSWFCMLFNDSVYFWDNCFGDKLNNVCGTLVEWYWQGQLSTRRNICLIATFSSTNTTWTAFCLIAGHRNERSVTLVPLLCWVMVT